MTIACLAMWFLVAFWPDGSKVVLTDSGFITRQECEDWKAAFVTVEQKKFTFECRWIEMAEEKA